MRLPLLQVDLGTILQGVFKTQVTQPIFSLNLIFCLFWIVFYLILFIVNKYIFYMYVSLIRSTISVTSTLSVKLIETVKYYHTVIKYKYCAEDKQACCCLKEFSHTVKFLINQDFFKLYFTKHFLCCF